MGKSNVIPINREGRLEGKEPGRSEYIPRITINIRIAYEIGITEAFFLSILSDLMLLAEVMGENEGNGRVWVTRSRNEWVAELGDLWGARRIDGAIANLRNRGIVDVKNVNPDKRDRTLSYSINWDSEYSTKYWERRENHAWGKGS